MTKKATKAPARKSAPKKAEVAEVETSAPADTAADTGGRAGKVAKGQLVEGVADRAGLTKKQSEAVVNAAMEAMVDAIKGGKSVGLPGLGTLSVKATAARTGVKPGTSEKIQIPAGKKVSFKVATTLKGSL
ncbi:HU family DNA-binding protein [Deinococcus sp. YIM 134068]|uniref:HU family DNA-binding protein n=1 Tax=Deinococcus lichenicola TaxID=3118910 RepID=UPI002F94D4A8